ncbi:MAG: porphobilinogen synthase [Desulforudis sp.]|jgi:porphobilinogen synthase|nr:MAG: porphobilinogen synthase [Desulforudis sp.]
MGFPQTRLRRLRNSAAIRRMIRETRLDLDNLMYPVFVTGGTGVRQPVETMPGVYRFSADTLGAEIEEVVSLGIPGVILFGVPDPAHKDEKASAAYADDGIVQSAVRQIKAGHKDLLVATDVCLCGYTSHGHCGMVCPTTGNILNDPSLSLLARTGLSHARAGADMVAPSDMMDGRVRAIRELLDREGLDDVPIMSYAAKYASAFYGPFREAADSAPQFGDRRSYQMDPANSDEAVREVAQDIEEGADIVMVKPALSYLDIIRRIKDEFRMPVAAYNVSGEYAMVRAAAQRGWVDERGLVLEMLTSIRRAGADIILTYFAKDMARWLREG